MMRRVASAIPRAAARGRGQLAAARRNAAAPAWAKDSYIKIYDSPFEMEEYPEHLSGGDHCIFSKLLFKLATAEKGKEDKYISDMTKGMDLACEKAGPFWADQDIGTNAAFDHLEPGVRFALAWMQQSRLLDKVPDVAEQLKLLINSSRKKMVATIALPGLPQSCKKQSDLARKAAEAIFAEHFPERKGWGLVFEEYVDPGIIDGWRVSVGGFIAEDMSAYRKAAQDAAATAETVDYTAVPAAAVRPTQWPQNIETEVLSQWCTELSLQDLEEQRNGV